MQAKQKWSLGHTSTEAVADIKPLLRRLYMLAQPPDPPRP